MTIIIILGLFALGIFLISSKGLSGSKNLPTPEQKFQSPKPEIQKSVRDQLIDFQVKKVQKGLTQDEFAQLDKLTSANPEITKTIIKEFEDQKKLMR